MPRVPSLLLAFHIANVLAGSDYGVPIEIQPWDTGRTPLAHMVDVTNEFGLKVLAEHNFLNDNNIAFSPYGLTGIMVALFEGVDGDSSYQIQRGMQLPWNRNIMRVGFRDIHRTLKTYFVPEEGFLAGLALNNENVTFNESYKKVLRFYGFDLDNDRLPTLPPQPANNNTNTTTANTNNDTTTASVPPAKEDGASPTPEIEETTPNSATSAVTDIDIRIPSSSTTPSPSSASNAESTPQATIAEEPSASPQVSESTTSQPTTAEASSQTIITTTSSTPAPTSSVTSEAPVTEPSAPLTTVATESTVNNEVEIFTTTFEAPSSAPEVSSDSTVMMSTETAPTVSENTLTVTEASVTVSENTASQTESEAMTTNSEPTTPVANESTLETLDRKKKSIVDFIFTNPPYIQDLNNYYRSFDVGPDLEARYGDRTFLANGFRNVEVTYMQYDSVLEHAYLPHLEASALRLPLDSDRYYLLVVLPSREGPPELDRLIGRMARESDLRDVYEALRPKRIRALVPSFTVKGHITLTTDLQKLGIRNVFEPRQRDFSPMTTRAGVYVRSVEQAVSVAIRKYRPDDHKRNRYVNNRYPARFSATYPFLYFVMDSSIHVALMAGKMVDPLNTRIL